MLRFDDRVVLITGAGRGIGAATAGLFAARGAHVVVNDRRPELVSECVRTIRDAGGSASGQVADIAESEAARAMVEACVAEFGRIDVVINSAGVLDYAPFAELPEDAFWNTMRVNLGGALNVTQAAWPHMAARKYGRVVVLPSQGMYGSVYVAHYSASKAALFGLMRSLSLEGAEVGIAVNAVIPLAYTPMMEELLGSDTPIVDQGSAAFGSAADLLPADRVAPAIVWFGHDTCDVTGTAIQAGGGRVGLVFLAETPGLVDLALTPESLRDGWPTVVDEAGYSVPGSFVDSLSNVMTAITRR